MSETFIFAERLGIMYAIVEKILTEYIHEVRRSGKVPEASQIKKDLYSRTYRRLKDLGLSFSLEKDKLGIAYYPERPQVKVTPVKSAYPTKEKFDVAVLDPKQANKDRGDNDYNRYWEQPVQVALKVQVCPIDKEVSRYIRSVKGDARTFEKYVESGQAAQGFCGVSLLFVQGEREEELDSLEELKAGTRPLSEGQQIIVITTLKSYWL